MIKLQALGTFITKLSKREKTVFYVAVSVVLILFLDRIIIYPIYTKIKSLNGAVQDKKVRIEREMRILAQKDRISQESSTYAAYLTAAVSQEEAMTAFLKEIETLANKSALSIIDMKPAGVKEEKDKSKKFSVSLTCEGEMEQILEFMYNVENSQSLLSVERYQVSPKSRESSVASSSMTISKIVIP